MKKTTLIFLLLLNLSALAQMQWHQLLDVNDDRVEDISFLNDSAAVICVGGEILRTVDGGQSWDSLYHTDNYYLRSIEYFDQNTIICGSLDSVMLGSFEGGISWDELTLPHPINGICGMDVVGNIIFATGSINQKAYVLKSMDGGASWSYMDLSHLAIILIDVFFINSDTGYVCGSYDTRPDYYVSPIILQTIDGGNTWQEVYKAPDSLMGYCWKLFPDLPGNIYASIESYQNVSYLRSSDRGQSWDLNILNAPGSSMQGIGFLNDTLGWAGLHYNGSPTARFLEINFVTDTVDTVAHFAKAGINRFHKKSPDLIYAVGTEGVFAYYDSAVTNLKAPKFPEFYEGLKRVHLEIYPNPVEDGMLRFVAEYPNKTQSSVLLLDAQGKIIHQLYKGYVSPGKKEFLYDMQHLPFGAYLIYENSYEGPETLKFLYQKK